MSRLIAINLGVFALLLVLIEIGGQTYHRWTDGVFLPQRYERFRRDAQQLTTVFEPHPYLVARPKKNITISSGSASITTTDLHTRATSRSAPRAGAITVAAVGGSTTFGTRLTDADTWPWLLQEKLGDGYAVINYGVPGYTTAEAIIQMALIVPEVRPTFVIFYEGWNDLRNYHWPDFSPDYYAHGMTQFSTLIPQFPDQGSIFTKLTHYSFVMGLLKRAFAAPVEARARFDEATVAPSDQPDPAVDRIYARNLGTLKVLAHRLGATALFVPQVLNDGNYSKTGVSRSWTPHIDDAAVPALMRRLNGLMSQVCAGEEAGCEFVPEPLAEHWDGNDFVDEGHFARPGSEKLASILAARIRRER